MTKKNLTKTERLLREMKRVNGMTHKEVVQYLLNLKYGFDVFKYNHDEDRGFWSNSLYGSVDKVGLFEKFCEKRNNKWHVVREISAPFVETRNLDRFNLLFA